MDANSWDRNRISETHGIQYCVSDHLVILSMIKYRAALMSHPRNGFKDMLYTAMLFVAELVTSDPLITDCKYFRRSPVSSGVISIPHCVWRIQFC